MKGEMLITPPSGGRLQERAGTALRRQHMNFHEGHCIGYTLNGELIIDGSLFNANERENKGGLLGAFFSRKASEISSSARNKVSHPNLQGEIIEIEEYTTYRKSGGGLYEHRHKGGDRLLPEPEYYDEDSGTESSALQEMLKMQQWRDENGW